MRALAFVERQLAGCLSRPTEGYAQLTGSVMNMPADDLAARNYKEFLMLYNKLTESCFNTCVTNMNYRRATPEEDACVQLCSSKWMNLNQRQMAVFMEVGPMAERQLGQVGVQHS